MDIIPIAILASDPITWEGSVALLSAHPDLLILPPELRPHARILLVITPAVTETVLRDMEDAQAATCCRWLRIVMAADHVNPRDFLRASRAGLRERRWQVGSPVFSLPAAWRARLLEGKVGIMSKPALAVLAAVALAVLAGCSGGATSAHGNARSSGPLTVSVCGFLKSGGLVAVVNRPGVVTSAESVTLEASNPGPAVRLDIATLTVGGREGVSGNVAGPDTVTVGRTFTIPARTAELTALATFPVSDPGLEDVPGPGVLEAVDDVSLASGC